MIVLYNLETQDHIVDNLSEFESLNESVTAIIAFLQAETLQQPHAVTRSKLLSRGESHAYLGEGGQQPSRHSQV